MIILKWNVKMCGTRKLGFIWLRKESIFHALVNVVLISPNMTNSLGSIPVPHTACSGLLVILTSLT
jgi:hypothetical protein